MQVFSGKIEGGKESINGAALFLSHSINGVSNMTQKILSSSPKSIKICSVEDCLSTRQVVKGMCHIHYLRFRRHGSTNSLRKQFCTYENCDAKHFGKGYCLKHYQRFWKYGNPSTVINNPGEGDSPEKRFWSKAIITANPDKCWEWKGKLNPYGKFRYKGKYLGAHCAAWAIANGRISDMCILHSCDNKGCVNPNHLREGTHAENAQDAKDRGRTAHGIRNFNAKLNDDKVREIHFLLKEGVIRSAIAKKFGVTQYAIYSIATGKTWKHVK